MKRFNHIKLGASTLALLSITLISHAQSAKDISFDSYQVTVSKNKKAPIKYNSHPLAKQFKSVITDNYQSKNINFAGHYIVTTWGCGSSCEQGAMVDTRTGKVYSLEIPMTTEHPLAGCYFANGEQDPSDVYTTKANSRLFLNTNCNFTEEDDEGRVKQEKIVKAYVWNESRKKFQLIKTQKSSMYIQLN